MLLANWQRTLPIKADEWLAHSYTIACSKMPSFLQGQTFSLRHYSDLSENARKKSLNCMAIGRSVIYPLLASPTRASAHFHAASSLFEDWDLFHLKASSTNVIEDTEEQFQSRDSTIPISRANLKRSPLKKPESPAKRSKFPAIVFPAQSDDETSNLRISAENWQTSAAMNLNLKQIAEKRVLELESKVGSLEERIDLDNLDRSERAVVQRAADNQRKQLENSCLALQEKLRDLEKDAEDNRSKLEVSVRSPNFSYLNTVTDCNWKVGETQVEK